MGGHKLSNERLLGMEAHLMTGPPWPLRIYEFTDFPIYAYTCLLCDHFLSESTHSCQSNATDKPGVFWPSGLCRGQRLTNT